MLKQNNTLAFTGQQNNEPFEVHVHSNDVGYIVGKFSAGGTDYPLQGILTNDKFEFMVHSRIFPASTEKSLDRKYMFSGDFMDKDAKISGKAFGVYNDIELEEPTTPCTILRHPDSDICIYS